MDRVLLCQRISPFSTNYHWYQLKESCLAQLQKTLPIARLELHYEQARGNLQVDRIFSLLFEGIAVVGYRRGWEKKEKIGLVCLSYTVS